MNPRATKPIDILLVEDNPADVRLTREALKEVKVNNSMFVVADGIDALAYLRLETPYTEATRPDLILLDLNMPRMDGFEVLQLIKQDPDLKRIPVVTLTTSQAEQDIVKGYNLHANAYVTKPVDLDQFIKVIKTIEGFWLEIVKLPDGLDAPGSDAGDP
jgi:CheY-like chemotaxis protein